MSATADPGQCRCFDDEAPGDDGPAEGASRREVLTWSSLAAMAAVSGCGPPPRDAVARATPPGATGEARHYATGWSFSGIVQPILVKVQDGQPVFIEGNRRHPASGGRVESFTQASLLDLHDPDRQRVPRRGGTILSPGEIDSWLAGLRDRLARGASLRLLTPATTSPTLHRQIAALQRRYPDMARVEWEPALMDGLRSGPQLGDRPHIVAIGADPLGPGPLQVAETRRWAQLRRAARQEGEAGTLLVAEAVPSLTGARADRRLPVRESRFETLVSALEGGGVEPELTRKEAAWLEAARSALAAGAQAVAGAHLPASLRRRIEALGSPPPAAVPLDWGQAQSPARLVQELREDSVDILICLDTNPVATAPGDTGLAQLLGRAGEVVQISAWQDETSAFADIILPLAHPLETWTDGQAADGSYVICQPVCRPSHSVPGVHDWLQRLLEPQRRSALDLVQESWRPRLPGAFADAWREAVQTGHIGDVRPAAPSGGPAAMAAAADPPVESGAWEVLVRPDAAAWDGRFTRNIWLQETPRPLNKLVWRNAASLAPADARRLGVRKGDVVAIETEQARIEAPVWIEPGQADSTIVLTLGYGRPAGTGQAGRRGYDAYPLRRLSQPWRISGARLAATGRTEILVTTQKHGEMEGHDFVRHVEPGGRVAHGEDDGVSLYPEWPETSPSWAMAIDLDLCTGCNACLTACQAENNIPVVGEDQVELGREMHWMRIDRYYSGAEADPETDFQPVPCMHCEQAPCEMGCPVNATVHSPDGLNLQIYNRCIGTRTCQAYCPYKVRRFNFLDWAERDPAEPPGRRNRDVSVRSRGVMEKCTYCVQRIQAADIAARMEDRPVGADEVVTACQAACPASAIAFGDRSTPTSRVARAKADLRHYDLLAELGVRPRTSYLARVRPLPDGKEGA